MEQLHNVIQFYIFLLTFERETKRQIINSGYVFFLFFCGLHILYRIYIIKIFSNFKTLSKKRYYHNPYNNKYKKEEGLHYLYRAK